MAEVLSQSEIDALLSALSSGSVGANEIANVEQEKVKQKKYDFRSPQKFSKDHIRTLETIHEKYARILGNYISGQLRKNVKMEVQSIEQITYDEFIHSIPNPTIISNFSLEPLKGNILMEINPQLSFQMLDILLGGTGERVKANKEFSDIDKNLMIQITTGMINNLSLAWDEVLKVTPNYEGIETNPNVNQTLAPNEPVALITFSIELGKTATYMNLCIPYLSVENILDKLVFKYKFMTETDEFESEMRDMIKYNLNPVMLNMRADIGAAQIRVDDFLKLVVGDVIKLDSKYIDPVRIYVEDKECYIGKPGILGKHIGIELLDIIDKDVRADE